MKRKIFIVALALVCVVCAALAFGCAPDKTYYSVTFMDGQTQIDDTVRVEKGKKIPEYPSPSRADENYIFDAWYKDVELTKVWNGKVERVTKDTTLYAGFLYVSATPGNAVMTAEAFSNTLTWLQRGITPQTRFNVELFAGVKVSADGYVYETDARYTATGLSGEAGTLELESYRGLDGVYTVKWTPAEKPLGGIYAARIECGGLEGSVTGLAFKGEGTETNPYLVGSATDLAAVNTADIPEGKYYKVSQSFTARLSYREVADKTFGGVFDGNGKTVTLEASDCGLFGTLGENAVVEDLAVAGSVANIRINCAGAIAAVNRGRIAYCTVSADMDSAVGTVGTLEGGKDGITGGAAGVAGINYGEISCCVYSGQIKANVGAAGVVTVNNGTVSLCSLTGTLGAANSNETGNSTKAYSYMGGIAAVNYAAVEKSSTAGSGKLLAQRGNDGTNDFVGGIVALNAAGATVSECSFDGIRVHGNRNVGGIAGANAGVITHCYAGGAYHSGSKDHSYVGGLSEVGGIVGLSENGGTVKNCFSTSNIYAYAGNAYKIAKTCENGIYLGGNLNTRDGISQVLAPEGAGNTVIALDGNDYSTANYQLNLTQEQLDALNGNRAAFGNLTAVRLACESISKVKEHTVSVVIDGDAAGTVSSVKNDKLSLKQFEPEAEDGYYFAGWALIAGGEIVFGAGVQIGYADLEEYGVSEVRLYPVFAEGEKPQTTVLSVALWTRYFSEDTAKALFDAYKASEYFKDGYSVEYTVLTSSNNNNFKTDYENGDFNVALAYKSTAIHAWQSSYISVYAWNENSGAYDTLYVGLNSGDDVVVGFGEFLAGDVAKKIMNPAYVSEAEAQKIEITLMNGGEQYGEKLVVSNATGAAAITLPVLEAEEGSFLGWALTAEAQDGEVYLGGSKGYDDLKDLASGGKLTLYARFSAQEAPEAVLRVAVFVRYIDTQYADNLLKAYCTAKNIDEDTVIFDYIGNNKTSVAEFGEIVNASDHGYDIVLACGTNITSTGKVETIDKKTIEVKGQTGRYIAILTENEFAQDIYAFVETDEGKAALNPAD